MRVLGVIYAVVVHVVVATITTQLSPTAPVVTSIKLRDETRRVCGQLQVPHNTTQLFTACERTATSHNYALRSEGRAPKVVLVTYATPSIHEYAAYSFLALQIYSEFRSYHFHIPVASDENYEPSDARWNKIMILQRALGGFARDCELIVWVDADLVVLDPTLDIEAVATAHPHSDMIVSTEHSGSTSLINSGFIILRNSRFVREWLLPRWWSRGDRSVVCDQEAFDLLYTEFRSSSSSPFTQTMHSVSSSTLTEAQVVGVPSINLQRRIAILPPDALNSDPPAATRQQPWNQVLHLMGDHAHFRSSAFRQAAMELCRVGRTTTLDNNNVMPLRRQLGLDRPALLAWLLVGYREETMRRLAELESLREAYFVSRHIVLLPAKRGSDAQTGADAGAGADADAVTTSLKEPVANLPFLFASPDLIEAASNAVVRYSEALEWIEGEWGYRELSALRAGAKVSGWDDDDADTDDTALEIGDEGVKDRNRKSSRKHKQKSAPGVLHEWARVRFAMKIVDQDGSTTSNSTTTEDVLEAHIEPRIKVTRTKTKDQSGGCGIGGECGGIIRKGQGGVLGMHPETGAELRLRLFSLALDNIAPLAPDSVGVVSNRIKGKNNKGKDRRGKSKNSKSIGTNKDETQTKTKTNIPRTYFPSPDAKDTRAVLLKTVIETGRNALVLMGQAQAQAQTQTQAQAQAKGTKSSSSSSSSSHSRKKTASSSFSAAAAAARRSRVCRRLLFFAAELLTLVQEQRRNYVLHLQGKLWLDYAVIAEAQAAIGASGEGSDGGQNRKAGRGGGGTLNSEIEDSLDDYYDSLIDQLGDDDQDEDSSLSGIDLAVSRLKKSLSILEAIAAEGGDQVLPQTLAMLGDTLSRSGRYKESLPFFDRSVAILIGRLGARHPEVAKYSFLAGQAHLASGDAAEALGLLVSAHASFVQEVGSAGAKSARVGQDLAHCMRLIAMCETRLGLKPGQGLVLAHKTVPKTKKEKKKNTKASNKNEL